MNDDPNERIDWPSDRIAQGGMFHPHKVTYSKETHDLINLLMAEQKMTMFQRNKVNYHLRNGDPLPLPRQAAPRHPQFDYEEQLASQIMQRARSARKRTLDAIQASGALETEKYVPRPHPREPSNMQKLKLQEKMSGIKEYPELDSLSLSAKDKYKRRPLREQVDPVEELMTEIQERADWLADMEALGEGRQHRTVIMAQIAERLRLVKKLERQRHERLDGERAAQMMTEISQKK